MLRLVAASQTLRPHLPVHRLHAQQLLCRPAAAAASSSSSSSAWGTSSSSSCSWGSQRRLSVQTVRSAADAGALGDMGGGSGDAASADPSYEYKPFARLRERNPHRCVCGLGGRHSTQSVRAPNGPVCIARAGWHAGCWACPRTRRLRRFRTRATTCSRWVAGAAGVGSDSSCAPTAAPDPGCVLSAARSNTSGTNPAGRRLSGRLTSCCR
jgi:hypothetical protein